MKLPLLQSVPFCLCIVSSVGRHEREHWLWPPGAPASEFPWSEEKETSGEWADDVDVVHDWRSQVI